MVFPVDFQWLWSNVSSMKIKRHTLRLVALCALLKLGFAGAAHALMVEGSVDYPVGVGAAAQNFNPNLGFTGKIYLNPMFDPSIRNYVSVAYQNLSLKTEANSSFRIFPVLAGLEFQGKVSDKIHTTLGGGIGFATAYLNSRSATLFRTYGYFSAQLHAGVEYDLGSGVSTFFRLPITYMVSSASISYLTYTFGANYAL
jgi:hypothetical protein